MEGLCLSKLEKDAKLQKKLEDKEDGELKTQKEQSHPPFQQWI